MPKTRILHPELAAAVATLRHGEMLFLADAGSGTGNKSLVPLDDGVQRIDLGVATGVPTLADVLRPLYEVGDFEAAIVAKDMRSVNPGAFGLITSQFGTEHVHEVTYLPDMYEIRNRVKVFVQTGDYAVHANVILVAGYPSPPIPMDWLVSSDWFESMRSRDRER